MPRGMVGCTSDEEIAGDKLHKAIKSENICEVETIARKWAGTECVFNKLNEHDQSPIEATNNRIIKAILIQYRYVSPPPIPGKRRESIEHIEHIDPIENVGLKYQFDPEVAERMRKKEEEMAIAERVLSARKFLKNISNRRSRDNGRSYGGKKS